jgi:hypothetical protein
MIARAIKDNFTSGNVADTNMEPANVVDVINKLAVYLDAGLSKRGQFGKLERNAVDGLFEIAEGLKAVAHAILGVAYELQKKPPASSAG